MPLTAMIITTKKAMAFCQKALPMGLAAGLVLLLAKSIALGGVD